MLSRLILFDFLYLKKIKQTQNADVSEPQKYRMYGAQLFKDKWNTFATQCSHTIDIQMDDAEKFPTTQRSKEKFISDSIATKRQKKMQE